jgi:hypothetical protein
LTTFRVKNYPLGGTKHQVLMNGQTHHDWTVGAPGEIIVRTTVADHTFVIR